MKTRTFIEWLQLYKTIDSLAASYIRKDNFNKKIKGSITAEKQFKLISITHIGSVFDYKNIEVKTYIPTK